ENGSAAFRRDHRVGRITRHEQAIGHTDGECPAGTPFPDHHRHRRHPQRGHLVDTAGDGLALAALLGIDTRVGPGRVDEGDQRQVEAVRKAHQPLRLAVAFRLGHAEVAVALLLGVAALLVADDHQPPLTEPCQSADDGVVVAEHAITMQLIEITEYSVNVLKRVRAPRMARQLGHLPGRQRGEDVPGKLFALLLELLDLLSEVQVALRTDPLEFLDLDLEVGNGLFEVEKVRVHGRRRGRGVRVRTADYGADGSTTARSVPESGAEPERGRAAYPARRAARKAAWSASSKVRSPARS